MLLTKTNALFISLLSLSASAAPIARRGAGAKKTPTEYCCQLIDVVNQYQPTGDVAGLCAAQTQATAAASFCEWAPAVNFAREDDELADQMDQMINNVGATCSFYNAGYTEWALECFTKGKCDQLGGGNPVASTDGLSCANDQALLQFHNNASPAASANSNVNIRRQQTAASSSAFNVVAPVDSVRAAASTLSTFADSLVAPSDASSLDTLNQQIQTVQQSVDALTTTGAEATAPRVSIPVAHDADSATAFVPAAPLLVDATTVAAAPVAVAPAVALTAPRISLPQDAATGAKTTKPRVTLPFASS